jgi:Helix-turn-helix domain
MNFSSRLCEQDQAPQLLTPREASALLRRSVCTLKRWRQAGTGPEFVAIKGRISYPLSALLQFLDQRTHRNSSDISNEAS